MRVNGKNIEVSTKISLDDFIRSNSYDSKRIAVELNGRIVSKNDYGSTFLTNSDNLEIVTFVGGG
jgi:thiamine biosynthesis protein ThiS